MPILIAVLALLSSLSDGQPIPLVGKRVTGPLFDGVIIIASPRKSDDGKSPVEDWTPSEEDVLKLEALLPAYANPELTRHKVSKKLSEYKRQYVGYVLRGRKMINVTFFHESSDLVKSGKWLRGMFTVCGGGDEYLAVRYDSTSGKFTEFWVNAPE